MTVMEALKSANEQLKHDDIATASPMLDAEVLLSEVLAEPKAWLFSHFAFTLQKYQREKFEQYIRRRRSGEPVAYITGHKEFYQRDFFVSPSVLIPRPATETLIEVAIGRAKDLSINDTVFADIGTGSGAIAITLAAETKIPVIAVDISPEALEIAKKNATTHQVQALLDFRQGNLLEPLVKIFEKIKKTPTEVDIKNLIICANLPYLSDAQMETLQTETQHEPILALKGGVDGLNAYWQLIRDLRKFRYLFPKNLNLILEIEPAQKDKLFTIISHDFPFTKPAIVNDMDGLERVVVNQI